MSQLLSGSICLTDVLEKAKAGHSAFQKAKNGKIYFNIAQWVNDEVDQYGNVSSIQLSSTKEKRDEEGKVYIGNCKPMPRAEPEPIDPVNDIPEPDDLPFN